VLHLLGFCRSNALASTLPSKNRVVAAQNQAFILRETADQRYKYAKHVVVAGLQPKTTYSAFRGPPRFVTSPGRGTFSRSKALQATTYRQVRLYTIFGVNFLRVVDRHQILTLASIQKQQIQITKFYTIRNSAFNEAQNAFVEKQVRELARRIDDNSRLSKLNKILNFQGWTEINGVPYLSFNAEGTYGRHYQNKRLSSTIVKVLKYFLEENKDLFTKENQFSLEFERSESEHCIPKDLLEGVLLNKEDSHTYQLKKGPHKIKTATIELLLPSTVKTIPESFIYNGEQTINLLQELHDEGKLPRSVESMDIFKKSIRECIKADIQDFMETQIPANAVDYPGQIKGSLVGKRDCYNLARMLMEHQSSDFNKKVCIKIIKECLNRSKIRAVYINKGLNQYPVDSPAHQAQLFHAANYVEPLAHVVHWGRLRFPELNTDTQFLQDHETFKDLMNGKGDFGNILGSPEYAEFRKALQSPDSRLDLIPRTAKAFIFKQKK